MSDDRIGQVFNDRYEILEPLGSGGMSSVYKAADPNLDRVVAIKIIHQHLSSNPDFVRRFRSEATSVGQLRHPNIVQVFDFDTFDDTAYIVFEYVAGESLRERLTRLAESDQAMPVADALKISEQVADALDYAHARGLVHRDVKPANVMLDVHGDGFLADFGIVKITDDVQHTVTGAVVGTARYMSPEQIRGTQLDGRSDIYSLGVTMFEMVSGRPPFQADSAMTLMMMHVTDPVPDMDASGIPEPLGRVIERALAKEPDDRYPDAGSMAADIREAADDPEKRRDETGSGGPAVAVASPALPSADSTSVAKPTLAPSADSTLVASPTAPSADSTLVASPTSPQKTSPLSSLGGGRIAVVGGALVAVVVVAALAVTLLSNGSDGADLAAGNPTEDESVDALQTTTTQATTSQATTAPPTTANPTTTAAPSTTTTATTNPLYPETVEILAITLEGGRYIVDYETTGYTEALPGEHVHFYWNNIYENEAGVGPNQADWYVWGGPRPFDGYTAAEQPRGATAMCAVVANPDHTIKLGTGNCVDLP